MVELLHEISSSLWRALKVIFGPVFSIQYDILGPNSYKNLTFVEENNQISPFSIHFFVINIRIGHAITQWMCYWCIIKCFNHSIPNCFVIGVVTTRRARAIWLQCSKWIYWTQTRCWIITAEENVSDPENGLSETGQIQWFGTSWAADGMRVVGKGSWKEREVGKF